MKVISDYAKAGGFGLRDVTGARVAGDFGVINDERLLGFQTGAQQKLLAMSGLEQVEIMRMWVLKKCRW